MNIEDGVKAVSNPEKNLKKKTTLRLAVKLADQTPPFPLPWKIRIFHYIFSSFYHCAKELIIVWLMAKASLQHSLSPL